MARRVSWGPDSRWEPDVLAFEEEAALQRTALARFTADTTSFKAKVRQPEAPKTPTARARPRLTARNPRPTPPKRAARAPAPEPSAHLSLLHHDLATPVMKNPIATLPSIGQQRNLSPMQRRTAAAASVSPWSRYSKRDVVESIQERDPSPSRNRPASPLALVPTTPPRSRSKSPKRRRPASPARTRSPNRPSQSGVAANLAALAGALAPEAPPPSRPFLPPNSPLRGRPKTANKPVAHPMPWSPAKSVNARMTSPKLPVRRGDAKATRGTPGAPSVYKSGSAGSRARSFTVWDAIRKVKGRPFTFVVIALVAMASGAFFAGLATVLLDPVPEAPPPALLFSWRTPEPPPRGPGLLAQSAMGSLAAAVVAAVLLSGIVWEE